MWGKVFIVRNDQRPLDKAFLISLKEEYTFTKTESSADHLYRDFRELRLTLFLTCCDMSSIRATIFFQPAST